MEMFQMVFTHYKIPIVEYFPLTKVSNCLSAEEQLV